MTSLPRLLISFSGGETSGYMTQLLMRTAWDRYENIVVVFANTGEENEETLEFVDACDRHFGLGVVYVEAVVHAGRVAPTHRVVSFATASRHGEPFEDVIRKYGVPNSKFKDCTRSLKRNPIQSYARSIGWSPETYDLAIGIRADEIDRQSSDVSRRLYYPLIKDHPATKPQINAWWARQPFRLRLKGYQGNCKWCWKKSLRKHLTLIGERPEIYEFPRRMEAQYGLVGPEFRKDRDSQYKPLPANYRRVFFRENRSVEDLFKEYDLRRGTFTPATDDAAVYDDALDLGAGCEDSCEVFSDEDERFTTMED